MNSQQQKILKEELLTAAMNNEADGLREILARNNTNNLTNVIGSVMFAYVTQNIFNPLVFSQLWNSAQHHHTQFILYEAASKGNLDCVQWICDKLQDHSLINIRPIFSAAVTEGHLSVVRYLLEEGPFQIVLHHNEDQALITASSRGHTEIVRYLSTPSPKHQHIDLESKYIEVFVTACRQDRLELVQYLSSLGKEIPIGEIRTQALLSNNMAYQYCELKFKAQQEKEYLLKPYISQPASNNKKRL